MNIPLNIAVDIGNSCLKCALCAPEGVQCVAVHPLFVETPSGEVRLTGEPIDEEFFKKLLAREPISELKMPTPVIWWVAQTGSFSWEKAQTEILKTRPRDQFKKITHEQIPLDVSVHFPEKTGVDRLLAAFAAVELYGSSGCGDSMVVVDVGSAITVDVVQNRTFCGGAILPGLVALSESYPKISKKLPFIPVFPSPLLEVLPLTDKLVYPAKNTEDAIQSGCYWGTVGAIRQFYEMYLRAVRQHSNIHRHGHRSHEKNSPQKNISLILTGGHSEYLYQGLIQVIPEDRIILHADLVLEGIRLCSVKAEK